jgi:hypothetical protein
VLFESFLLSFRSGSCGENITIETDPPLIPASCSDFDGPEIHRRDVTTYNMTPKSCRAALKYSATVAMVRAKLINHARDLADEC